MEEWGDPQFREVYCNGFRIIYRLAGEVVAILTVRHGSRLLGEDLLTEE